MAKPAIVGVWAPEPNSCAARHSREGILPAIISTRGAQAGENPGEAVAIRVGFHDGPDAGLRRAAADDGEVIGECGGMNGG